MSEGLGSASQGTMRSAVVIVSTPALNKNFSPLSRHKYLAVQQLGAQFSVEAFAVVYSRT